MDTEAWRTLAAIVGALGGASGLWTAIYNFRKDRRAAAKEAETRIQTRLRTEDAGRLLEISFEPRDFTERLAVEVTAIPKGGLTFVDARSVIQPDGSRPLAPQGEPLAVLRSTLKAYQGRQNAQLFVNKRPAGAPQRVRITIKVAGTKTVLARTTRHIND